MFISYISSNINLLRCKLYLLVNTQYEFIIVTLKQFTKLKKYFNYLKISIKKHCFKVQYFLLLCLKYVLIMIKNKILLVKNVKTD